MTGSLGWPPELAGEFFGKIYHDVPWANYEEIVAAPVNRINPLVLFVSDEHLLNPVAEEALEELA